MNNQHITQQSYRQAVAVLKALSHLPQPTTPQDVPDWIQTTQPLQSMIQSLCERDRTGSTTTQCVYTIFELMTTQGEAVSPAIWDILNLVEEQDIRTLLTDVFLKEPTTRLKTGLLAMIHGACTCGGRIPKLEMWCRTFIQSLEDRQKYSILLSVSEGAILRLLHGITLPHTQTLSFSLFERLLYPMTRPYVFNLVIDHLPGVLLSLQDDDLRQRFAGLMKTLLGRFPPGAGREESYRKLALMVGDHPVREYNPGYSIWNQKTKPNSKLSSVLECPVCYERFVTPITACENGHCICSNCRERLKNCPICRGHISNIRMTIMDQIMEMTDFHCKNADAGCNVKLPYKDIWGHEMDCEYRTVSCDIVSSQNPPKLLCNEDVVVLYFHEHMEKCHRGLVTEFELNTTRRGELKRQRVNEVRLLKEAEGGLYFVERVYVSDEEIFLSYHYVGRNEDARKFVYTVKVSGGGVTQKISYTNFCLPNYMGVLDAELSERCLVLDPEKMFFPQGSKVEYSVRIEDVNVYRMRTNKNKFLGLN